MIAVLIAASLLGYEPALDDPMQTRDVRGLLRGSVVMVDRATQTLVARVVTVHGMERRAAVVVSALSTGRPRMRIPVPVYDLPDEDDEEELPKVEEERVAVDLRHRLPRQYSLLRCEQWREYVLGEPHVITEQARIDWLDSRRIVFTDGTERRTRVVRVRGETDAEPVLVCIDAAHEFVVVMVEYTVLGANREISYRYMKPIVLPHRR